MSKSLTNILEKLSDLGNHTLNFDEIIIHSELADNDPQIQLNNIINSFNGHKDSIMIYNSPIGKLIQPNQFRLVALNKKCELVAPSNNPSRMKIYLKPGKKREDLGFFDQESQYFIGTYGSYLINVPMGKLALAWRGNTPIILSSGSHVIHDQNLKNIRENNLVDSQNSANIQHGIINIIRVIPGSCCKIWINNTPFFNSKK